MRLAAVRVRSIWAALVCASFALTGALAQEQPTAQLRALTDALRMDAIFVVMQREAVENADDVAADLFGSADQPQWRSAVAQLYDAAAARLAFDAALQAAPSLPNPDHIAAAIDFFTSDLGQRITELELAARRDMIDDQIEAAAQETWAVMQDDPMPLAAKRVHLLRAFVAVNDLIDGNVTATMNSNFAFYQGMAEAGGAGGGMSREDMLRAVTAQEAQVRRDTEDWIYAYLALAYAPLSDADLQAYIDFSATEAGQSLSRILFAAFDILGAQQSRGMGLAAGRLMGGQDI